MRAIVNSEGQCLLQEKRRERGKQKDRGRIQQRSDIQIKEADGVMTGAEWNEYRNLDLQKLKEVMKGNVIIDCRNVLGLEKVRSFGFIYEGVGRKIR